MIAAAMSTSLLEFMYLVYGRPTIRLCKDGVRISSAVRAVRDHAEGLSAATWLNRDHNSLMVLRCSSGDEPLAARTALSKRG